MLSFDSEASFADALSMPLDPVLRQLLADRIEDAFACGLADMTHILVIQPGDTEVDIIDAIGFSPLVHRIHGTRQEPDWDWRERHNGWTELLYIVDGSSFACILFVQETEGVLPELLTLCRASPCSGGGGGSFRHSPHARHRKGNMEPDIL